MTFPYTQTGKKIQSVSVLKNEAATAKYGKKGKFGVILITTKRE